MHFSAALTRYRDLLKRAQRRGAPDYVAWITRNILELRVWVEYCSQSPRHAEEFFEDAIRDLQDLHRAVGGFNLAHVEELQRAIAFIGTAKPPHRFKDVKQAAEDVGLLPLFKQNNKILSKLVHPTAMSVVAHVFLGNGEKDIRRELVASGMSMTTEAFQRLDASLLGEAYRKYRKTMTAVLAALPKDERPY